VESLKLQVDRDTVLQARAAVLGEVLRLRDAIRLQSPAEGVGLCGGDPVSDDAAAGFNERIRAMLDHCRRYAEDLEAAGHSLADVARRYGFTEAEITSSFTP
jgi:hypothetical protein